MRPVSIFTSRTVISQKLHALGRQHALLDYSIVFAGWRQQHKNGDLSPLSFTDSLTPMLQLEGYFTPPQTHFLSCCSETA